MPSDLPRRPLDLAQAADRFVTALNNAAGMAASGLAAPQLLGLAARAQKVRDEETAKDTAEGAYGQAVEKADAAHEDLEDEYRKLRKQADGHANMTDALREAAGIGTDDDSGTGELPLVEDLAAVRRPSGLVFLDWSGPTGSALRYEVFTREGEAEPWAMVGSATATHFAHEGAAPGHRHYRVEPVRGKRRGESSNVAALDA